tara:strand:+ start:2190 stop:3281 length:1092 start_codon:yes stop_codon:yes gene_type:complete
MFEIIQNSKRLKPKQVLIFTKQLSILLKQNITLDKAIDILNNNYYKKNNFVKNISKLIKKGHTLSYCFEQLSFYSKYFDSFFINLIKIGEQSASLNTVLENLQNFQKSYYDLKTEIRNSCIYPSIILLMLLIFIIFVTCYLIPTFEQFYKNLNISMPYTTLIIINIKNNILCFINKNIYIMLSMLFLIYYNKNCLKLLIPNNIKKTINYSYNKIVLNIPIIGKTYLLIISYKFIFLLYISLKQNLNIIIFLEYFIKNNKNLYIKKQLIKFKNDLTMGYSFNNSIKQCKFIPKEILQIITLEQKSENITENLNNATHLLELYIKNNIKTTQKVLEPTLTIFLTLIICCIICLLYMPLINLDNFL